MTTKEYNGWKNRVTWNVALHVNNTERIYNGAVVFMAGYTGSAPYRDFCRYAGLENGFTPDRIQWVSHLLDYKSLDEMMREI